MRIKGNASWVLDNSTWGGRVEVYGIVPSGVEELVQILSENEVTSEDKREYIEYVEASLPDPEIISLEEENDVHQEEEEFDLEEIQDVILREKLLSINRLIANIESLNDNPTPDCVLNSFASILIFEESDNSLSISDNSHPNLKLFVIKRKRREVERLINVLKNDISNDSTNDLLLEEVDLFLA
nr:hypothetical protein [Tanacetum cinerariifolium]